MSERHMYGTFGFWSTLPINFPDYFISVEKMFIRINQGFFVETRTMTVLNIEIFTTNTDAFYIGGMIISFSESSIGSWVFFKKHI